MPATELARGKGLLPGNASGGRERRSVCRRRRRRSKRRSERPLIPSSPQSKAAPRLAGEKEGASCVPPGKRPPANGSHSFPLRFLGDCMTRARAVLWQRPVGRRLAFVGRTKKLAPSLSPYHGLPCDDVGDAAPRARHGGASVSSVSPTPTNVAQIRCARTVLHCKNGLVRVICALNLFDM